MTAAPALLVRFSDEEVRDAEDLMRELTGTEVHTLSASEAVRRLRESDEILPRCTHLGVVGDPPDAGIGYALAPLLAAFARPRRVTIIDERTGQARTESRGRYLMSSAHLVAGQLLGSGTGIAAQHLLARYILFDGSRWAPPGAGELPHILYLRPTAGIPARVGGSVSHAHGVIRAFRDLGVPAEPFTVDPSIAATAAQDPDPPCEWRVVQVSRVLKALPASAALGADLALAGASYECARSADFIYQRHARFSLVGAMLARVTGKPLFLEYNGSLALFNEYIRTPFAGQLALCEKATVSAATRIFVTSEIDRDNLLGKGIAADRIVVNPNGVDPDRFATGRGPALREKLGFGEEDVVIGFVGSFGPWHGAPKLAEAFIQIAESEPRTRLLLVGDGREQSIVRQKLAEAGLSHRALFLGKLAPTEIPDHMDACDVLAAPNVPLPGGAKFHGSPTKLFEYMAAGKAIAASRLGQIGDVLQDKRTALLVEPGDAEALAAALERLVRSPELRAKLGAGARRAAIERHTWKQNAMRIVDTYREMRR